MVQGGQRDGGFYGPEELCNREGAAQDEYGEVPEECFEGVGKEWVDGDCEETGRSGRLRSFLGALGWSVQAFMCLGLFLM